MERRTLWLLLGAVALSAMGYGTLFTVVDDFRDVYGIAEARLGLILGIGFVAGFLSLVLLAPLADRGHAKRMILAGIAVLVVSNIAMGFGETFWVLLTARFVMGVGAGMIGPAVRRLVIVSDPGRIGSNLGLVISLEVGGFALGPVVSAVTVDAFGISTPFLVVAGCLVPVWIALSGSRVPETAAQDVPSQRLAFDMLALRPYAGVVVIGLALYLMIGTFDTLWSVMMKDLDAGTWMANLGITVFALPMLLLGPIGGRLTQRVGPFVAMITGLTMASVFMAAYGLVAHAGVLLAIGLAHGIVDGLTITGGTAAIATVVPRERLAAAQGLYAGMQTLMGGAASVLAGWSYGTHGRTVAFLVTTFTMLLLVGTGSLLARDHLRAKPAPV